MYSISVSAVTRLKLNASLDEVNGNSPFITNEVSQYDVTQVIICSQGERVFHDTLLGEDEDEAYEPFQAPTGSVHHSE